jgi:valyl-tRNA synthetase
MKPAYVDGAPQPIDATTYAATIALFEDVLKLLHPFMPFLTEEIWHHLRERGRDEDIMIATWPKAGAGMPRSRPACNRPSAW